MARRRGNWTASLHPRDYRGRFKKKGSGSGKRPSRSKRFARGANTYAQVTAAALVGGAVIPVVGAPVAGYVALNRRRNSQLKRREVGLRSTLTGRRLT